MTDLTLPIQVGKAAGYPKLAQFAEKDRNSFGVVRLLAAIAVVFTHSFGVVGGWQAAEPLHSSTGLSLGAHAVHVFFALSGFMVAASFERSSGWIDFVLARVLRVMPALICVNLAIVVVGGLLLTAAPADDYWTLDNIGIFLFRTIVLFSVGTPLEGVFADSPMPGAINIPIWTIRYEVLCYATLLLLLGAMASFRLAGTIRLVSVLAVLAATAFVLRSSSDANAFTSVEQFARFMFAFYLGVAAWLVRDKLPVSLAILVGLSAIAAVAVAIRSGAGLPLMIVATSYGAFWLGSFRMGWLQRRTATTDLSYGVYIMGFFIQQWLAQAFPETGPYANTLLALIVVMPLAWLSWELVEKPALGLRKRWKPLLRRAPAPVGSAAA